MSLWSNMVGNLEKLETLSFLHSDVKELPKEIGNLTNLKVLDLTGCGDLFNIVPGVLQSLIHLEELYMSGTLISWPDEQITTCISELNSLSLLNALELELSIYDLLPHDLNFSRLKRFRVCIGFSIESKMFQNTLKIRFPAHWEDSGCGIEVLFNRTEILHLHGWCLLPNSILNKPERASFLMLRSLKLEHCDISYLTEIGQGQNHFVGEITTDEQDQLPLFENLHDLEIVHCVNLRRIFSLSSPTDFLKLESLKIIACETTEEIFLKKKDEKPVVEINLPNLKCLILEDLPCLTGFCNDVSTLVLPQLLEFRLRNLPKLQSQNIVEENTSSSRNIFLNQKILSTTQLKLLSVSKMNMNVIQKHILSVSCFVNLRVMSLCYCDDLSSVVLCGLLQKPKDLKVLHVERCPMVDVVFDIDRLLTEGDHVVLNSLTELELEHLPTMTHIWKHGPETFVGFQNLTKLSVANCHQLTHILLPSIATILLHLQELSISECRKLTVILKEENEHEITQLATDQSDQLVFPRLKSLDLIDLPCLKCFCLGLQCFIWPLLESVWIDCCKEMMVFTGGSSNTPKLREISINGQSHTMEVDLNTDLKLLQQQLNDGNTSDSTLTSSLME